jgi:hypothetical protein
MANQLQKLWQTQFEQLQRNAKVIAGISSQRSPSEFGVDYWNGAVVTETEEGETLGSGTRGGAVHRYLSSLGSICTILDNVEKLFGPDEKSRVYRLMSSSEDDAFQQSQVSFDQEAVWPVVRRALNDEGFSQFLIERNSLVIDGLKKTVSQEDSEQQSKLDGANFLLHVLYMNLAASNVTQLLDHIVEPDENDLLGLRALQPEGDQAFGVMRQALGSYINAFNELGERALGQRKLRSVVLSQVLPVLETSFQALRIRQDEDKTNGVSSLAENLLRQAASRVKIPSGIGRGKISEFVEQIRDTLRFSSVSFLNLCDDLDLDMNRLFRADHADAAVAFANRTAKRKGINTFRSALKKLMKRESGEAVLVTDVWDEEIALSVFLESNREQPVTVVHSVRTQTSPAVFEFPSP